MHKLSSWYEIVNPDVALLCYNMCGTTRYEHFSRTKRQKFSLLAMSTTNYI